MNKELILTGVRIAFCQDLIKPKAFEAGSKARYTAQFIFDRSTPEGVEGLKKVKAAWDEIQKAEFPKSPPKGDDTCLRDGNERIDKKTDEIYPGFEGNFYLAGARAESQGPPMVVPRRGGTAIDQRHDEFPRAGDYVNLKVSLYSMGGQHDKPSKYRKICCEIKALRFNRRGEALAGGGPANAAGLEEVAEVEDDRL